MNRQFRQCMALLLTAGLLTGVGATGALAATGQIPLHTNPVDPAVLQVLPGASIGDAPLDSSQGNQSPTRPSTDPEGIISFANVGSQIRLNNPNYQDLQNAILTIEELDYDELQEDMREQMNSIASAQWQMITLTSSMGGMISSSLAPLDDMLSTFMPGEMGGVSLGNTLGSIVTSSMRSSVEPTLQTLDQAYDNIREQYDSISDGDMQKDNADVVRQLQNAENTIVAGGEALYIATAKVELTSSSLSRSDKILDRSIQELELRYRLGQIPATTLQQTKAGKTSLASGKQTLDMNISNMKMQLENLLGAELTGNIQLQDLPEVTGEQLAAMDLTTDLAAAKAASYDLYDAKKTLDDAKETYEDAIGTTYDSDKAEERQAYRTWQQAQTTYNNTVQAFEMNFRTLYNQVKDYKQILDADREALAQKQSDYQVSALQYNQGTISKNKLLSAQDAIDDAQETVDSAIIDLFSAYNNYRWAVDYGIINS